ncbi:sugar ABC transporter substrate-binding protein [candidate division KSB1 bacterium]|nr:sugar ABC transporter substrate-binding protein [candidate division KSB1 bacterium]
MRNWMLRIGIFIWVMGLGCQRQPSHEMQTKITLTYWSANNQYEINLARAVVAEWNAAHPNIQVIHQSIPESQSSEEVILSAVVSKTTPDIYSNIWPGDVELYVEADALVNLDQFADFDSVTQERFLPDILAEARSPNGHIYQIPWKTNPIMIIYNKKMLAAAGFKEFPKTYSDYFKAAEKITLDTNQDGYFDHWMGLTDIRTIWWQRFFDFYSLYIAASGGQTLVKNHQVIFENPAAEQVFQFLQTIFQKGYFPKEKVTGRSDVFLGGFVATRFTGPWEITHAEKLKPAGFEYDFAALPVPDAYHGPRYTYGDFKNIVIFSTSKYPAAAWKFVKFMINRRNDLRLLEISSQLPLRKNILQDSLFQDYFRQNPKMQIFAQQAQYVRGADSSPVLKEIFDAISREYEACVVYGVKIPQSAVKDAAARARHILK